MTEKMSAWAETIMRQKYLHPGESTWEDIATRVVGTVMTPTFPELVEEMTQAVIDKKFMPGGRYLYATGKQFHQTQNCLLLRVEDNRESISNLLQRVSSGLMTGAGIGIVWSALREEGALVKGMGGASTGPLAFMQSVNEVGRHIMQGGARRSAIWAGLHWNHPDVFKFIAMKNWDADTIAAKEKNFNSVAPMDGTNISVILDTAFFIAYEDEADAMHRWAHRVYWTVVEQMLTTAEPGFSIDAFENEGENLRNAPVTADTHVLTDEGYQRVGDLADRDATLWTGKQWVDGVKFLRTMIDADVVRVSMTGGREIRCEPTHEFLVERYTGKGTNRRMTGIDRVPAEDLQTGDVLHVALPESVVLCHERDAEMYTLGWLYGDGSFSGNKRAELTLCSDESKSCLSEITGYDSINMSDGRGFIRAYWRDGFAGCVKEQAPELKCYSDVASFIAGLFDADGNWEPTQGHIRLSSKHQGFLRDVARMLESLGILAHVSKAGFSTYGKAQTYQMVIAADSREDFVRLIPTVRVKPDAANYNFKAYRPSTIKVLEVVPDGIEDVFCADVRVEEHSFMAEGVIISNCTEVTSSDDNDICNLGSINLAKVETLEEMRKMVQLGTAFLISGTLYSKVPYAEVAETREKNRRLGLGLMGIYEWLVARGYRYEANDELGQWLDAYTESDWWAKFYADRLGISVPVKTRAIAPTGTIGILAETTTGIEPLFAVAMKRRYLKGRDWHFQYVVDATAKRLMDAYNIAAEDLETAHDLAKDPERRIAFQSWVQQYVDHGISSTLNLPSRAEQDFAIDEFGDMLMKYLPTLRGVTCYPDGSRGGQPLNVVPYAEAAGQEGIEYAEWGNSQACVSGVCGV